VRATLAGRRTPIEREVEEVPAGPERDELVRELVAIEVELRRRQGESPTPDEYLGRFPGVSETLDPPRRAHRGPGRAAARASGSG
jgi:hypothetical protein